VDDSTSQLPRQATEPRDAPAPPSAGATGNSESYRFEVAFSFAGDDKRPKVREIAESLRSELGDGKVFFDEWFEAELAGHDANLVLQSIYRHQSRLVVICVCGRYDKKSWPQDEWRAIQSLERTLRDPPGENKARLRFLPLRFGDGDVEGLSDTALVPDVRERPAAGITALIVERLELIRGAPSLQGLEAATPGVQSRLGVRRVIGGVLAVLVLGGAALILWTLSHEGRATVVENVASLQDPTSAPPPPNSGTDPVRARLAASTAPRDQAPKEPPAAAPAWLLPSTPVPSLPAPAGRVDPTPASAPQQQKLTSPANGAPESPASPGKSVTYRGARPPVAPSPSRAAALAPDPLDLR
jgi:hypothetical protein